MKSSLGNSLYKPMYRVSVHHNKYEHTIRDGNVHLKRIISRIVKTLTKLCEYALCVLQRGGEGGAAGR